MIFNGKGESKWLLSGYSLVSIKKVNFSPLYKYLIGFEAMVVILDFIQFPFKVDYT